MMKPIKFLVSAMVVVAVVFAFLVFTSNIQGQYPTDSMLRFKDWHVPKETSQNTREYWMRINTVSDQGVWADLPNNFENVLVTNAITANPFIVRGVEGNWIFTNDFQDTLRVYNTGYPLQQWVYSSAGNWFYMTNIDVKIFGGGAGVHGSLVVYTPMTNEADVNIQANLRVKEGVFVRGADGVNTTILTVTNTLNVIGNQTNAGFMNLNGVKLSSDGANVYFEQTGGGDLFNLTIGGTWDFAVPVNAPASTIGSLTVSSNAAILGYRQQPYITLPSTLHFNGSAQYQRTNVAGGVTVTVLATNIQEGVSYYLYADLTGGAGQTITWTGLTSPGFIRTNALNVYLLERFGTTTNLTLILSEDRTLNVLPGAGNGNTNYTLWADFPKMIGGSSNINITAVMGGEAGKSKFWSASFTNLSAITWGFGVSSATNTWRWLGGVAPTSIPAGLELYLSGESRGPSNNIVGWSTNAVLTTP